MTEQLSAPKRNDVPRDAASVHGGGHHGAKTPLYEANNADRYQRQTLIKQIQNRTKRTLICYVSGAARMVDRDDVVPFVDLLHNIPRGRAVDLLLHTSGGSINAAEKLMGMTRGHVGTAELRTIVPDFAKSAGTLMVLGADKVIMSDMSELGPIDPQIHLSGKWQSVQNYLDAFDEHAGTLKTDTNNVAARIMLSKLAPDTLLMCKVAVDRARQAAEDLLRRGMFRNGGNFTRTVKELLDTRRWLSHGQMISWEDALDSHIGLAVEYCTYHSDEWQDYWRLYCLQRLAVGEQQKLYESAHVSLVMGPSAAK